MVQQYLLFLIKFCYLSGFMCFIERETQNFILKFREIFLWRETVLSAHGMKSDECRFSVRFVWFSWEKMVLVVIDRYFTLFLKGLKILLNPRLSLIVPLSLFIVCPKFAKGTLNHLPCVTIKMAVIFSKCILESWFALFQVWLVIYSFCIQRMKLIHTWCKKF